MRTRLRLLVACERAEIEAENGELHPFIAGGINESVWTDDPDTADRQVAQLKAAFDPGDAHEWREVWATFSEEQLRRLFAVTTIVGVVLAAENQEGPS